MVLAIIKFVLQDIDFFQHLEMHMHSELQSLVGRDHLSFRSYYLPVKVRLMDPVLLLKLEIVLYTMT